MKKVLLVVSSVLVGVLVIGVIIGTQITQANDAQVNVLGKIQNFGQLHASHVDLSTIVEYHDDGHWYIPFDDENAEVQFPCSIEGQVDIKSLTKKNVHKNSDGTTTIKLPHATIGVPVLDRDHIKVLNHDKGFAKRVEDFFSSNIDFHDRMLDKAEEQCSNAAKKLDMIQVTQDNAVDDLKPLLGDKINFVF